MAKGTISLIYSNLSFKEVQFLSLVIQIGNRESSNTGYGPDSVDLYSDEHLQVQVNLFCMHIWVYQWISRQVSTNECMYTTLLRFDVASLLLKAL